MKKNKTKTAVSILTSVCTVCNPTYIFAMDGGKATNSDIMQLQKSNSFNLSDLTFLNIEDVATKIKQKNIIFSEERSHELFANANGHAVFSPKFFKNKNFGGYIGSKSLDEIFGLVEEKYGLNRNNKYDFYRGIVDDVLKPLVLKWFNVNYRFEYKTIKNMTAEEYFFNESYGMLPQLIKKDGPYTDYEFVDKLLCLFYNIDLEAQQLGISKIDFQKLYGDKRKFKFNEMVCNVFLTIVGLCSLEYGIGCPNRLKGVLFPMQLFYRRYINFINNIDSIDDVLAQIRLDMATNAVDKYCEKYLSDKDGEFIDHCKRTHIKVCCEFLNLSSALDLFENYCKKDELISNLLDCLKQEITLKSLSKLISSNIGSFSEEQINKIFEEFGNYELQPDDYMILEEIYPSIKEDIKNFKKWLKTNKVKSDVMQALRNRAQIKVSDLEKFFSKDLTDDFYVLDEDGVDSLDYLKQLNSLRTFSNNISKVYEHIGLNECAEEKGDLCIKSGLAYHDAFALALIFKLKTDGYILAKQ